MAPYSHQRRSAWLGYSFLGISVLLTLGTLFLALTDRSLADLTDLDALLGENDSTDPTTASDIAANLTPVATPTATPGPELDIPEDIQLTAQSAYVIHRESDDVLFERNADLPLQPASTAKIFTAMVVLEHANPEEVIEIMESDVVDPVAESSMGLAAGDWVTVHDLLVGLMLPSGNDAANALSRTIGARIDGEESESFNDRFLREMNRVADELGLQTTELRHAAGHDREGQTVTARELAVAAEALLERPSLLSIVAMKRAEIRVGGDNPRVLIVDNTNELLVHDGVFGVKTGTTSEAGECLVIAYREGGSTFIAVLLGSEARYEDARTLLSLPQPPAPAEDEVDGEPDPEHTDTVDEPIEPET